MPKLVIPRSNLWEKEILAKHNIQLIKEIALEEFEKIVKTFLKEHNVLHLATCRDNAPRCTPLEYWSIGMNVHIVSEGGGKIPNLKANANVCYSIADPFLPQEDFFGCVGMQIWGVASLFKRHDDPNRFQELFRHSHYIENPEGMRRQNIDFKGTNVNFNVITIEPVKIRYLNLRKGIKNIMWQR